MRWLRLLFSFYGRINRTQYWTGLVIAFGGATVAPLALYGLFPESDVVIFVGFVLSMGGLPAMFALMAKRLHDLDITAWWILAVPALYAFLFLVPPMLAGLVVASVVGLAIIVLGVVRGQASENRHGPVPTW